MPAKKVSLEKLNNIFESKQSNRSDMMFRNMFATACYLSLNGEAVAAQKTLRSLFDWLGWDGNKTYFSSIGDSLSEFALDYAYEVSANLELNKLFVAIQSKDNRYSSKS